MKQTTIVATLLIVSLEASAAPYFRLQRPLDEVKSGVFVKVGTPDGRVSYGLTTTLIKHRAEDGYLLIPGVGWSLLDVGFMKPEHGRANLILGPSVDLSEPVKAVLLRGLDALYPSSMGSVRALLQPAAPGKSSVAASIGPGVAVDPGDFKDVKTAKGALVIHGGLQAKFQPPF